MRQRGGGEAETTLPTNMFHHFNSNSNSNSNNNNISSALLQRPACASQASLPYLPSSVASGPRRHT